MAKKMLIDATHAEETRVVVVDGNKVEEFDFESENKRQLAGNIYLAKVTRVEPSLQAAFVDYGGNRHGFLAFSEIHPDYYQIPVADREKLMEEERAYAEAQRARDEAEENGRRRKPQAKAARTGDKVVRRDAESDAISGMETIDLGEEPVEEGSSPMERVAETPVEEPAEDQREDLQGDDADEDDDHGHDRADEIESVGDDDDVEDILPQRKPRPRKYKIQEVVKVRQIMLVQVVKEERGNKGAALTTYLSLAGRYCVLMPNTERGGGISRKITNAADRKKLKEIAQEIEVPRGAGLIVRTAGAKRTKAEIKRDYEYLLRLWEQIRELTLKSIAPAKIYEEGDLIKRSIRDLYSRDIDEVLVEGDRGYRIAKDFMKMIMPSHAVNVKQYRETLPLFARYQVETYLAGMFNPTVQLKSGGYIVIGVTEALVAIDVNSGRATKEGSIEETALKTNLEAADEVARQLRLRDLAGLIVIDFIDMDERRNNAAVEKRLKDKLKTDRARIQVGRISGFGLLEMSRQRLRPGMIEATTQPCPHCHGTGLVRSDDNLALAMLRAIEEEGTRRRSREVLLRVPVAIANYLMNQKREHVAQIEGRYGMSVRIEGDPTLISPDYTLEKFKTATRVVVEAAPVISVDTTLMDQVDEDMPVEEEDEEETSADSNGNGAASGSEDGKPKKRRRRRRRRGSGSRVAGEDGQDRDDQTDGDDEEDDSDESAATTDIETEEPRAEEPQEVAALPDPVDETDVSVAATPTEDKPEEAPARTVTRSSSSRSRSTSAKPKSETAAKTKAKPATDTKATEAKAVDSDAEVSRDKPAKPAPKPRAPAKPRTTAAKPKTEGAKPATPRTSAAKAKAAAAETVTEPPVQPIEPVAVAVASVPAAAAVEPVAPAAAQVPDVTPLDTPADDKPKRRGWWSPGR